MKINIGNVIKKLRTERNITQEDMASYLGITPQAISRWESEACYPDIELLPSIASFFSVSTDELLGIVQSKRDARIDEIHKAIYHAYEIGKYDEEELQKARTYAAEFPHIAKFQAFLANQLTVFCTRSSSPDKKLMNEAERIYQTLIANAPADTPLQIHEKHHYIDWLVFLYAKGFDDAEKVKHALNKLPSMCDCNEAIAAHLNGDKYIIFKQKYIAELTVQLFNSLSDYILRTLPDEPDALNSKIEMLLKLPEFMKFIFGDNLLHLHYDAGNIYRHIAAYKLSQGKATEALDYLEMMCEQYVLASEIKLGDRYASPFTNRCYFMGEQDTNHNVFYYVLHNKLTETRYDPIRKTERFKAIIEKMERISEIRFGKIDHSVE